ncbi:MAG: ABC transporter permease subunit, partial [Mycobacteriales bacterium]
MNFPVVTVLVLGLAHGATYALLALGISLVYKASRVVNFAQGEVATLTAFVAWQVIVRD